eukprot:TRINITY_DN42297_c0_g1_i1.p1 TRINITY_DN42297_c0_g1~~TRINITY_DN42297_c0_g1_i1.p1  ORF type:complete len:157 (-),score=24.07 TRINITY_DN42297_c0_g1_i1:34-504(-)
MAGSFLCNASRITSISKHDRAKNVFAEHDIEDEVVDVQDDGAWILSVTRAKNMTIGQFVSLFGGIPERELQKLQAEADFLGYRSHASTFYTNSQEEDHEHGVTIARTEKKISGGKCDYNIFGALGHRDSFKNTITDTSQPDGALPMFLADGNFTFF